MAYDMNRCKSGKYYYAVYTVKVFAGFVVKETQKDETAIVLVVVDIGSLLGELLEAAKYSITYLAAWNSKGRQEDVLWKEKWKKNYQTAPVRKQSSLVV